MKALSTIKAVEKFKWPYHRTKVCELTLNYECNARCIFCYGSSSLDEWKGIKPLNLKQASSYMLDSYKSGARIIQILGGEPTIYQELPSIINIARKIGYPVIQIVTNGQRLQDYKYAQLLKKSGLNSITFSIHSSNPQIHNKIVGVENAFENILKAIENSIRLSIHISTSTAVSALNYKDIPGLTRFLYENFAIESYHFVALHFIGGGFKHKDALKTTYTTTIPYIKQALDYLSTRRVLPISPILSNYQPCILAGFEHLITDWEIPFSDDDLYLPEKVYKEKMYSMITNNLRMKTKKCRECIYYRICAGFEKMYFENYGDEEFKPLKFKAKPFPLSTFYKK